MEVSELFSELGDCVDDIAFVRSMYTNVPNHEPSLMMMNCGDLIQPRAPVMGSLGYIWIGGTENQNLPGFVVMCPGGDTRLLNLLTGDPHFLPGAYQGTHLDTKHTQIEKLISNIKNKKLSLPETASPA